MERIRQLAVKGTDPSFRMIPRLFPVMPCARRASKTEQNCSEYKLRGDARACFCLCGVKYVLIVRLGLQPAMSWKST
eukprot:398899-Rhodomonas_salina.1